MKILKELEDSLLAAPQSQLDPSIVNEIKQWKGEASSLDILFILDKITYFSLASEFVVGIFQMLLEQAMQDEEIDFDYLTSQRTWKSPDFLRS